MYRKEVTVCVKTPHPPLRVVRRGMRTYVIIPPQGDAPRKAEAFDWRKPGNEPEGKKGADSANGEG